MNKMTKKLLSGFMAFAMVFTMLPVSVFADGEDTVTPPTETPVEQPADSPVNGDAEGESEDKPADDTKDEPSSDNTSTGGDNTSDDGNNTSNDGNNAEENAALTKIAELQAQADALTAESENLQASCKAIYDELMAVYEQNKEDQAVYNAVDGVMAKLGALGFDPYAVQVVADEGMSHTVTIKWEHGANTNPANRPASVTVQLFQNYTGDYNIPGTWPLKQVTITGDQNSDTWSTTLTGLPTDVNVKIDSFLGPYNKTYACTGYSVSILSAPEDYKIKNIINDPLTLIYNPTTDIYGIVTWVDAGNADNMRTDVTVNLTSGGSTVSSKTVSSGTFSYTDMDKYDDSHNEIQYGVELSAVPDGYKVDYGSADFFGGEIQGHSITLTRVVDVPVSINWVIGDEAAPEGVKVQLTSALSKDIDKTVTSFTEKDVQKYTARNQSNIDVKVTGLDAANYSSDVVANSDGSYTITITKLTSVTAKVVWDDNNNADGLRPSSVTATLKAEGVKVTEDVAGSTLTNGVDVAEDSHTFSNLPKYNTSGVAINYTVDFSEINYYTARSATEDTTVTNTYTPNWQNVTATITWDDANDQDGKRPDALTLTLKKAGADVKTIDGESPSATVSIDGNTWTYTWTKMPKGIDYAIVEPAYNGYKATVTNGLTYKMSRPVDVVEVKGTVTWIHDGNNTNEAKPEKVTLQLCADGEAITGKTVDVALDALDNANYSFGDMAVNAAKQNPNAETKAIEYTVTASIVPASIEDYEATIDSTNPLAVKVRYAPDEDFYKLTIKWDDADNQDGLRVSNAVISITNKANKTDKTDYTLSKESASYVNNEAFVMEGSEYEISVVKPDGYDHKISGSIAEGEIVITLTHTPETIDISGAITWDDADNQDGVRPDSVSVKLSNGTTVTADATGGWKFSFEGVDKYAAGKEIAYTVEVDDITDREDTAKVLYTATEVKGTDGKWAVTLTHEPDTTASHSGTITWVDDGNKANLRPNVEKVTVLLYADESTTPVVDDEGNPVTPTWTQEQNVWTYTFSNLQTNKTGKNGKAITYSSKVAVPDNYTAEVEGTVTTLTLDTIEISAYVLGEKLDGQTINVVSNGISWTVADGDSVNVPSVWKGEYDVVADKVEGYYTKAELIPDVEIELKVMTDALGVTNMVPEQIQNYLNKKVPASSMLKMLPAGKISIDIDVPLVGTQALTFEIPSELQSMIDPAIKAVIEAAANSKESADNYIAVVTNTLNSVDVDILTAWVDNNNREGKRPATVTFNGDNDKVISGSYESRGNFWYEEDAFVVELLDANGKPVNHMYSIFADRDNLADYTVNDIAIPLVLDASLLAALPMDDLAAAVEKIQNELETLDPAEIDADWLTNAIQTVMAYDLTIGGYSVEELMTKVMDKLEAEGMKNTIKAVADKAWNYAMSKGLVPSKWIVVNMNTYTGEVTAELDYILMWNDYDYSDKRPNETTIKVESEKAGATAASVEKVLNKNNYSGYIWFQSTNDRIAYADANDLTSTGWNIDVKTNDNYESLALAFPIVLTEDGQATTASSTTSADELAALLSKIKGSLNEDADADAWTQIEKAITDYVKLPSLDSLKAALEALSGNIEAGNLGSILGDLKNVAKGAIDALESIPTIDVRLVVVVMNTYVGERYAEVDYITIWNDYDYEDKRPSSVTVTVTSKLENATYAEASEQVSGSGYIWYNSSEDKIGFKELDQLTSTGNNIKVNGGNNVSEDYITHKMAFPVVLSVDNGQSSDGSVLPTITASEVEALLAKVKANLKDGVTAEDWTKLENTIKEYAEMPNLDKLQAVLEGLYQNVEEGQYSVVIGKVAVLSSKLIDELKKLPDMDVRLVVVVVNTYVGERQVKVDILKIWNDNNDKDDNRPDEVVYEITGKDDYEQSSTVSGNVGSGVVRYAAGVFTVPYNTLNAAKDLDKVQVSEKIDENNNAAMVDNYVASDVVMIPMLVPEIGETSFDYKFELPADAQAKVEELIAEVEDEAKDLIKDAYESIKEDPTVQNLQNVLTNLTTKAEDALTADNLLNFVEAVAGVSEDQLKAVFEELKNSEAAEIAGAIATLLGADPDALEEFVNTLPSEVKGKVQKVLDEINNAAQPTLAQIEELMSLLTEDNLKELIALLENKVDSFDFSKVEFRLVAVVVNSYEPVRDLVITKKAYAYDVPTTAVAGKEYTFTVKLSDTSSEFAVEYADGATGTFVSGANGSAITVKSGESVVIKDIPAGVEYTVTENEQVGSIVSYKTNVDADFKDGSEAEGVIHAEKGVENTVEFKNLVYNVVINKVWSDNKTDAVDVSIQGNGPYEVVPSTEKKVYIAGLTSLDADTDVTEVAVPMDYVDSYKVSDADGIYNVTVTNTYNPVRDLVISKDVVAVGNKQLSDTTPFEIEVVLTYADGTKETHVCAISEGNPCKHLTGKPVGTKYVVEETVPKGYINKTGVVSGEVSLDNDDNNNVVELINQKYNVELRKVWNGPEQGSVKVKVANEEFSFAKSVVAYIDGAENLTTADVKELNIPNNYTASYAITTENGIVIITITNTYTYNPPVDDDDDYYSGSGWSDDDGEKLIVRIKFDGVDEDVFDKLKVNLLRNGKKRYSEWLSASKVSSKDWRYVWKNLDEDYRWSVALAEKLAGYDVDVDNVRGNYWVITISPKADVKVNPGTGAF